jgi:hypothetical protein
MVAATAPWRTLCRASPIAAMHVDGWWCYRVLRGADRDAEDLLVPVDDLGGNGAAAGLDEADVGLAEVGQGGHSGRLCPAARRAARSCAARSVVSHVDSGRPCPASMVIYQPPSATGSGDRRRAATRPANDAHGIASRRSIDACAYVCQTLDGNPDGNGGARQRPPAHDEAAPRRW